MITRLLTQTEVHLFLIYWLISMENDGEEGISPTKPFYLATVIEHSRLSKFDVQSVLDLGNWLSSYLVL